MSSRVTTISLDEQTEKIKNRIPNFSKFVRQCLLRWDAVSRSPNCPVKRINGSLVGNVCVPARTRICLKHWPNGPPLMDDWRRYRDMIEFDGYHQSRTRLLQAWDFLADYDSPFDWIQDRAKAVNDDQIDFDDMELEGNAKPENDRRRKKTPKKRFSIVQLLPFLRSK